MLGVPIGVISGLLSRRMTWWRRRNTTDHNQRDSLSDTPLSEGSCALAE
jgi:hypothetical protein